MLHNAIAERYHNAAFMWFTTQLLKGITTQYFYVLHNTLAKMYAVTTLFFQVHRNKVTKRYVTAQFFHVLHNTVADTDVHILRQVS